MATPVIMPRQGQSVESCLIIAWRKNVGDSVAEEEVLCEVETDKATFEIPAPCAGSLLATFFEPDDDVPVLTTIAAIGEAGEDVSDLAPGAGTAEAAPEAAPAPEPVAKPSAAPEPSAPAASSGAISPRARRAAAEHGFDPAGLSGSGPHGRIIERDITKALAEGPHLSPAAIAAGGSAPQRGSGPGGLVRAADMGSAPVSQPAAPAPAESDDIPVTGVRKIIAERMLASIQGTAQLTLSRRCRAKALLALRARFKSAGAAFGLDGCTIGDAIAFAIARTLTRHAELNAHFLGDTIRRHSQVDLGFAVDTPRGLMVPVLRNAATLSLAELSAAVKDLAKGCREGGIAPDLLSGATCTLTNLGAFGVEQFTPVLNPPEVAIVGIGAICPQAFDAPEGIVHEPGLHLSLTIDHRAVDGAPAARFLADLASAIENIDCLLAS